MSVGCREVDGVLVANMEPGGAYLAAIISKKAQFQTVRFCKKKSAVRCTSVCDEKWERRLLQQLSPPNNSGKENHKAVVARVRESSAAVVTFTAQRTSRSLQTRGTAHCSNRRVCGRVVVYTRVCLRMRV
jgi:hypothetical protein